MIQNDEARIDADAACPARTALRRSDLAVDQMHQVADPQENIATITCGPTPDRFRRHSAVAAFEGVRRGNSDGPTVPVKGTSLALPARIASG
jgi:hypothetical protein